MGMLMSGIVSFLSCPADHKPPSVTSTASRMTAALLRSEKRVMRSMGCCLSSRGVWCVSLAN